MSQEQIFASLDEMLANPKSKNFLNHLVRSYVPFTKVQKVWDRPKGDFKCVITKESLFSTQDILEGIQSEEFKKNFMESLKIAFDETTDKTSAVAKLVGDKKMGVSGEGTTTYMSYEAFQHFYDWVITKSLKGDKHINWLLSSLRRDVFVNRAKSINDSDVQKQVNKMAPASKKQATYTLGDASNALLKLKQELEKNEN
jgi:hypothetical protein